MTSHRTDTSQRPPWLIQPQPTAAPSFFPAIYCHLRPNESWLQAECVQCDIMHSITCKEAFAHVSFEELRIMQQSDAASAQAVTASSCATSSTNSTSNSRSTVIQPQQPQRLLSPVPWILPRDCMSHVCTFLTLCELALTASRLSHTWHAAVHMLHAHGVRQQLLLAPLHLADFVAPPPSKLPLRRLLTDLTLRHEGEGILTLAQLRELRLAEALPQLRALDLALLMGTVHGLSDDDDVESMFASAASVTAAASSAETMPRSAVFPPNLQSLAIVATRAYPVYPPAAFHALEDMYALTASIAADLAPQAVLHTLKLVLLAHHPQEPHMPLLLPPLQALATCLVHFTLRAQFVVLPELVPLLRSLTRLESIDVQAERWPDATWAQFVSRGAHHGGHGGGLGDGLGDGDGGEAGEQSFPLLRLTELNTPEEQEHEHLWLAANEAVSACLARIPPPGLRKLCARLFTPDPGLFLSRWPHLRELHLSLQGAVQGDSMVAALAHCGAELVALTLLFKPQPGPPRLKGDQLTQLLQPLVRLERLRLGKHLTSLQWLRDAASSFAHSLQQLSLSGCNRIAGAELTDSLRPLRALHSLRLDCCFSPQPSAPALAALSPGHEQFDAHAWPSLRHVHFVARASPPPSPAILLGAGARGHSTPAFDAEGDANMKLCEKIPRLQQQPPPPPRHPPAARLQRPLRCSQLWEVRLHHCRHHHHQQQLPHRLHPPLDGRGLATRLCPLACDQGPLYSRRSTMNLTMVPLPAAAEPVYVPGQELFPCTAPYGVRWPDNSVDMGSGFDCFNAKSWPNDTSIPLQAQFHRMQLTEAMQLVGDFAVLDEEFWHFTLNGQPFPDTKFDFPVC